METVNIGKKYLQVAQLKQCSRCGKTHDSLTFREFDRPVVDEDGTVWAFWALCPYSGDPILLKQEVNHD